MNTPRKFAIVTLCVWPVFLFSLAMPTCCARAEAFGTEPIYWWSFDQDGEKSVLDQIQKKKDPVYGNHAYVPGVQGKAIKLDGFRTYIRRDRDGSEPPAGAFTVESWIALASYPWSWSPVVDCSTPKIKGFFLGVDPTGHVGFKMAAGSAWYEAITEETLSLRTWTHVAAVFEPNQEITVFINGKEAAVANVKGHYVPARRGSLTLGRTNRTQTWREFQLTTEDMHFFLDGLLDEVKIFNYAKTPGQISREYAGIKDLSAPALSRRDRLPTGPVGSGSFGAFYTRLNYYKEWDDLWRVSDVPDVFVRFDESPVQLVFWRGASFVPCWVTENGIWYLNEWLETWGSDVISCAEPIMDRDCRYSHVRLIENTEARCVIHWRYALSDAEYTVAAVADDGRGEWCDEFHIIYPDQVGVRKMALHYSRPERKHDWVEQIVVLPPGKYPDDVMERDGVSLVNMAGDVHAYSWHDDDLKIEMPEPKGANMSYVHLKSKYRPFFIVSPDPVKTVEGTWDSPFFRTYASKMATGYRQDPVPSVYGWWNHWPVAQVPGDGRWVSTPDRPSHFNLTTFVQWNDHEYTEKTRTRIMLQGMTDKTPETLVPLARSWLQAPVMRITSKAYRAGGYDQSERAYLVERRDARDVDPCTFVWDASRDSPLLNPAIIVKNWGSQLSTLSMNGKKIKPGKDFRQGIRKGPLGDDLILWIRLDAQKFVTVTLGRAGK
ncbi:MAG: LamG domain-containing protein [Planctomycetes bacterium]|nr:LamG domain-containing protein [Planctomycetota bacterium]